MSRKTSWPEFIDRRSDVNSIQDGKEDCLSEAESYRRWTKQDDQWNCMEIDTLRHTGGAQVNDILSILLNEDSREKSIWFTPDAISPK